MKIIEVPSKLNDFIYVIMKEARRKSLTDILDEWEITETEYEEIEKWFREIGVNL